MRLLLITGIPGTGKTTIGNFIAREHGFMHLDRELIQAWPVDLQSLWIQSIPEFVSSIKEMDKDIVLTWGFMPGYDDLAIKILISSGFKLVWLDGNREAARKAFINRGTVPEELLDIQMRRIEGMDLASFNPVIINPFDNGGSFLDQTEMAQKILDLFE